MDRLAKFTAPSLALLRIMSGLLLMQHGMQKLFLYPPSPHHPDPIPLLSLFGIAGILEFFGGLLLVIGLFTRLTAFILAGEMAVAYWFFHFAAGLHMPNGLFPVVNEGDLAILFCFVFLHFCFAGPGAWSIDALRTRRHSPA
jgi:putative oxidoreductase